MYIPAVVVSTKTRTINIIALPNHAPTVDDLTISTSKNQSVDVNVTAEDSDGDTLMYNLHTMPDHGTLTGELPNMLYTPDANYTGQDYFTFSATDGQLLSSNEANVSITITDTATTSITITGQITDINGSAITGATVTIDEKTTSTDNNGSYSISGIEASERINVNVTHPDYLANSKVVIVAENKDLTMDIKLGTPKATLLFASTEGATLSSNDGASVELPADGYIDANGTAYTGDVRVKMSYYPITTQSGRATFPGTFDGIDSNGSTFPIKSYGFMNVELTDPQGNALNLDGSSTAALTFPKDNNIHPQPTTIPLWYYDEAKGYWIEDGAATNVNNSEYSGTVTHFTSWNLDIPITLGRINGCVVDINGNRVPGAHINIDATNWVSAGNHTDIAGNFSIRAPINTSIHLSSYGLIGDTKYSGVYNHQLSLQNAEIKSLNTCLVLNSKELGGYNRDIIIKGRVFEWSSNTPVANKVIHYAPTFNDFAFGHNIIYANNTTDNDGYFSIKLTTTYDSLDYIFGSDNNCNPVYIHLQPNVNIYNIGDIAQTVCY